MNLLTAIAYAQRIADRVRAVNGLLATPVTDSEAIRIRRIWVFGSTVKGSQSPNDLDLLIDIERAGRRMSWRQAKYDRRFFRACGVKVAPDAEHQALAWIAKGMKKVSRHPLHMEGIEIDVKVMVYPRDDLTAHMARLSDTQAGRTA